MGTEQIIGNANWGACSYKGFEYGENIGVFKNR